VDIDTESFRTGEHLQSCLDALTSWHGENLQAKFQARFKITCRADIKKEKGLPEWFLADRYGEEVILLETIDNAWIEGTKRWHESAYKRRKED
jgi:hypothetical protein